MPRPVERDGVLAPLLGREPAHPGPLPGRVGRELRDVQSDAEPDPVQKRRGRHEPVGERGGVRLANLGEISGGAQ